MLTEKWELISMSITDVKSDWEVSNTTKEYRDEYTSRYFWNNFTKEIRRNWIHIIINLSQEHRPFIWENQDNVLDSIEGNSHCHEEKCTVSVLNTLNSVITILEKNNCKYSSNNGDNNFHIWGLGKSKNVEEVSLNKKTELIAPTCLLTLNIFIRNFSNVWSSKCVIVS